MIEFFSNINLDKQSFWIGFLAGAIFLWFVLRLRIYLPRTARFLKGLYQDLREGLTTGAEIRYRNEILNYVQQLHITSVMFSLDEIVIPPSLMMTPRVTYEENETVSEDIVNLTVPYLPDWPELAAKYNAPTLSLVDALSNGANLILIGYPGSGRTVSLAYLATLLLRRDTNLSSLDNLLPIYIHAHGISVPSDDEFRLANIISIISKNVSTLTQQRLPALINNIFEAGKALLLIDGLDEISAEKYQMVIKYIQSILEMYPDTRMIVTTSPNNFSGLPQLGLIPTFMAAWNEAMIDTFLSNFSQMWRRFIHSGETSEDDKFDYLMIESWLESYNNPQGPLELTLRIWSTLAEDLIGADVNDNIEAYIRRTTTEYPTVRPVLEQIASQMLLDESFIINQGSIDNFSKNELDIVDEGISDENGLFDEETVSIDEEIYISEPSKQQNISTIIPGLGHSGLFISYNNEQFTFSHPLVACYLAGSEFSKSNNISKILDQEDWGGKTSAIEYYLHFNVDGKYIIDQYLDREELLQSKSLSAARWLKSAESNSSWYSELLRYAAGKLQNEALTMSLGGRFLTALTLTNDAHVATLYRNLLNSEQANIRQLAALGCGLIRDKKSVGKLAELINDPIPGVSRAACLALVAIGDKNSLETVATALLQGTESVRRYAAEALANHPDEGHPALRDGSLMDDLLVRRAVIFGLARINQSWAKEILEKMQLEDQQWLVRNAAIQVLEEINRAKPQIPKPTVPLNEVPWLIEFASKLGIGVAPGKPAIEMLIRALRDGDEELRLLALDYLRLNGFEEVLPATMEIYQSSLGEVREAAFNTLWHLSESGFDINYQLENQIRSDSYENVLTNGT